MHECAVCRDEVEAFGGVVQALPMAAHQYEAPRGLRRRICVTSVIIRAPKTRPRRAGRYGDARASCLPPARPPSLRVPAWS